MKFKNLHSIPKMKN